MGWIGLRDRSGARPAECKTVEMGAPGLRGLSDDALLARGTLAFELAFTDEEQVPRKLLEYERFDGWQRRLTVYLNADYSLSVDCQQGSAHSYVRLSGVHPENRSAVLVSCCWDAPERTGLLSVENLSNGAIRQAVFAAPIPLPAGDARRILECSAHTRVDRNIRFLAISDRAEPIGPRPTIAAGALVETVDGPRPIERIRLGDQVVTQTGGPRKVRWILRQELPARGQSTPITLRAPYFGLSNDITVTQEQKIVISGADTEYDFGRRALLVQARELIGHPGATVRCECTTMTCYQLLLDEHDCLLVSGAWLSSLFIGRLALAPEVVATTGLAEVPASFLPVHPRHALPVLQPFEARALHHMLAG